MTRKRKYKSDAFEAIHSSASALHKVGAISKDAMQSFDDSCLKLRDPGSEALTPSTYLPV
jgi:DNA-binding transcriptional regulator YiaG